MVTKKKSKPRGKKKKAKKSTQAQAKLLRRDLKQLQEVKEKETFYRHFLRSTVALIIFECVAVIALIIYLISLFGFTGIFFGSPQTIDYNQFSQVADPNLMPTDQQFMLYLARNSSANYVHHLPVANVVKENLPPSLEKKQACFVSFFWHNNDSLRGSMGHVKANQPLYKCVMEHSISATTRDPRFETFSKDELPLLYAHVSVLSTPEKLVFNNREELINKIDPNKHGLMLKVGSQKSVLLPHVWKLVSNNHFEFLYHLCRKAGAAGQCWERSDVSIFRFTATEFSEKELVST